MCAADTHHAHAVPQAKAQTCHSTGKGQSTHQADGREASGLLGPSHILAYMFPSAAGACLSSAQAGSVSSAETGSQSRAQAGRLSQCSPIHKEHCVTAVDTCAPSIPPFTVITGPMMQQQCSNGVQQPGSATHEYNIISNFTSIALHRHCNRCRSALQLLSAGMFHETHHVGGARMLQPQGDAPQLP